MQVQERSSRLASFGSSSFLPESTLNSVVLGPTANSNRKLENAATEHSGLLSINPFAHQRRCLKCAGGSLTNSKPLCPTSHPAHRRCLDRLPSTMPALPHSNASRTFSASTTD